METNAVNYQLVFIETEEQFRKVIPLLHLFLGEEGKNRSPDVSVEGFLRARATGYVLMAAYSGSDLAGLIALRPVYDPLETGVGYFANNFIVDPAFRGKGVDDFFEEKSFAYCRERGALWMAAWVGVSEQSEALGRYYRKLGFEKTHDLLLKKF